MHIRIRGKRAAKIIMKLGVILERISHGLRPQKRSFETDHKLREEEIELMPRKTFCHFSSWQTDKFEEVSVPNYILVHFFLCPITIQNNI